MSERLRPAAAAVALLALVAGGIGAGSTLATGHAKPKRKVKPPTAVRVVARDFSYVLSRLAVPAGRIRFTVVNRGAVAHDFAIGAHKTRLLRPGQSAVLTVSLPRAGRFAFRCTVSGHAALGMRGTLAVGKAALPPATTTKPATTTAPPTTTGAPVQLQLTKIGDFARPVYVTAPPGDPNHLFVAEQRGTVQQVVDGQVRETPFLDVTDHVLEVSERGFLGIAFAPDYATSGLVYVDYTDRTGDGNVNVVEFRGSPDPPDHVDPYSARQILEIVKPYENTTRGCSSSAPTGTSTSPSETVTPVCSTL